MRPLLEREIPLMRSLLAMARRQDPLDGLLVEPLADGEMGSLQIGAMGSSRKFGRSVAEAEFTNLDGVLVVATLNADTDGQLLELDMWRVDFAPLQRWPDEHEVRPVPSNPSLQPTAFGRG
jgi:hypothetical protein